MMQGFHPKFTWEELIRTNHSNLQAQNIKEALKYQNAGKRLSKLLGSIRESYGFPISITSGFRCPALNRAVGSMAKTSSHMRFEAADCIPVGKDFKHFFNWLNEHSIEFPDLRKAIIEHHKGLVHIEVKMDVNEPQVFYTTNDNVTFKAVA
jgi:hypothetical protein